MDKSFQMHCTTWWKFSLREGRKKRAREEDRGIWSDKKIQREGSWSPLGTGKGCRPIKMVCLPRKLARQHSHMHRHIPRRNGGGHGLSLWQTVAVFNCCYHTPGHHGTKLTITNAVKKHGTKLSYFTENVRENALLRKGRSVSTSIHVMHTDLKTPIPNFCISWFQRAWHKTFCDLYDTLFQTQIKWFLMWMQICYWS